MHLGGVNSLALALTAAFCGANQHNHGLLVSWALQGEGMACAPWYVRQRLRRASGRCGSCVALVFSFAPSIRLRGLKNVITITYRVKKREKTCEYDLKVVLLFHRKGNGPSHNSPAGQEIKKMNIQEALNVFGLSGELTEKDIKAAYRKAALKYHPDRNPLGAELMKAVNAAFDVLMANIDKINQFQSTDEHARYNYGDDLEKVLNVLSGLSGLVFEVIGNWVWISGETITHKETLKEIGCKWAAKKKQWFYRPDEHKSYWNREEHTIEEIRAKYGTTGQRRATGWQRVETRA